MFPWLNRKIFENFLYTPQHIKTHYIQDTIYTIYNHTHVNDWQSVNVPTPPNLNSTLSPMFAHGRQYKEFFGLVVWPTNNFPIHAKMNHIYTHMVSYPSMHYTSKYPSLLDSIILGTINQPHKNSTLWSKTKQLILYASKYNLSDIIIIIKLKVL